MINIILWIIFSIFCFQKAYKVKTSENYREAYMKNITVRDDGEVVTFLRNYKSKEGYLKYTYIGSMAWGIFFLVNAILRYSLKFRESILITAIFVLFFLTDYMLYRKHKTV